MKKENLVYAIAYTIVLVAAIMKILHYPIASPILTFSLVGITTFQSWHIAQLKRRIMNWKENKDNNLITHKNEKYFYLINFHRKP